MKKLIIISAMFAITAVINAQQFPFMEGYNINPFNMSPSFAGLQNTKSIFADYRSDWSGVTGGPVTCQLSYNDRIFEKVGVGGRFIYDKTDIFKQILLLGTYTYEVKIGEKHFLNFGLSAGFYRNSIDLAKYYNDPTYVPDPVLIYGLEKSKVKFATDLSGLYRFAGFEGGIMFSNVMFGSAKYNSSDIAYKPMKNYLLHTSYNFELSENWAVKPFVLLRGGEHIPIMVEAAANASFKNRVWGMLVYRTGGIWGMGFGGEVYDGIILNYSYNMSTNVALNTFGSHQITIGVRILKKPKTQEKAG